MSYWPDQRTPRQPPQLPRQPPWAYEDKPAASERSARLTLTLLAASFGILVVGLVVFLTVRNLREGDHASPSPAVAGPVGTTPEQAAKVAGGLGPAAGTDVVSYGLARKAALAAASGDRIAIVSFWNYTTEAKAKALVGDTEVVGLLAAAPGGQPAFVPGGLAAWVTAQTAETRAERDEINKLLPTVDDPQFKTFYRGELDRLNRVINSITPTGDLVFGLVVRAPSASLQQFATKPEVRIVDVGPTADLDPKQTYRGLRPEENSKANDPNTRPV